MRDWGKRLREETLVVLGSMMGWMALPSTKAETHEDKGIKFGSDLLGLMS